jgi:hypothetical protein
MAEIDFNPARKPAVYDYIYRLNAAFARVHRNLELLDKVGIFDAEAMASLRSANQELQADTNYKLLETLSAIEQRDRGNNG